MVFEQGSFEWFRDVVGLSGNGIVLRSTHPHLCGGQYLRRTLSESHATVQECDLLFSGRVSHNGFKFRRHPNESLRLLLKELFRRVHQVDDSVNHDVSRTFARGVFAQVKRDLNVNWAAFAVVTCHWKNKTFVPHPLWADVQTPSPTADSIDMLLQACRKSLADNQVHNEPKQSLELDNKELKESSQSKGKAVCVEDHSTLVYGTSCTEVLDIPISNFFEAGPSNEIPVSNFKDHGPSHDMHISNFSGAGPSHMDSKINIPPSRMKRILKKVDFLKRHGGTDVLMLVVILNWRTVCAQLRAKCYVDNLVKTTKEIAMQEEIKRKEELVLKEEQLMEQEKAAQRIQDEEFGTTVAKLVYVILQDKFKGVVNDTILKVTPHVQKRQVGKILGCPSVPNTSPPKKKRSPPSKPHIEEPEGCPAQNTRSQTRFAVKEG